MIYEAVKNVSHAVKNKSLSLEAQAIFLQLLSKANSIKWEMPFEINETALQNLLAIKPRKYSIAKQELSHAGLIAVSEPKPPSTAPRYKIIVSGQADSRHITTEKYNPAPHPPDSCTRPPDHTASKNQDAGYYSIVNSKDYLRAQRQLAERQRRKQD